MNARRGADGDASSRSPGKRYMYPSVGPRTARPHLGCTVQTRITCHMLPQAARVDALQVRPEARAGLHAPRLCTDPIVAAQHAEQQGKDAHKPSFSGQQFTGSQGGCHTHPGQDTQ